MRRMAVAATIACALLCGCYAEGNGIKRYDLNERAGNRFAYEPFSVASVSEWQFGYVVDTETGVTYLVFSSDEGSKCSVGGITPLLNRDGTPVIDGKYE